MEIKQKCNLVLEKLNDLYDNPKCELNFNSAFELLVAVILSAQCTDKRVNKVTENLFKICNTPQQFCDIDINELENIIYPCGFFRNKAKNLKLASESIVSNFNGNVPDNLNELVKLNGVGRKTANVVLSLWFKQNAIAVDTHVFRVSNRIGIAKSDNVLDVEKQLMKNFPSEEWSKLHYSLVLFGRYVCKARNPQCKNCIMKSFCNYYLNLKNK